MQQYTYMGAKSGEEKPYQPVETPNNLVSTSYGKVLLAVGEGEFEGQPTGKDIFLDGTPLIGPSGSNNFGGVKFDWRKGTIDQDYIPGMPDVSNEIAVGYEVKFANPWVRLITKQNLDAVRVTLSWGAFLRQTDQGDILGTSMGYAIDMSVDGAPFVLYSEYKLTGKTNSGYERTHRVNFPKEYTSIQLRVRRLQAESTSSKVSNAMTVKTFAEVVDVRQRYPHTALLYVEFDARTFGSTSIPKISVKTKGRVIQVPRNYDPETRTYTGVWSGDFKWAWTNNPAWVFYDIVTQSRFGLGNKVTPDMVDKWSLYEVAQYCDVMVPKGDGSGDMEPRHTCNVYIQEKEDAWKVLRDIASIFNGMTYWNGNTFVALADKQEDLSNIPMFSRANVINGRFDYQAADDKSIYTSALVSFDDPENHFNTAVEATWERSEILRWGGDRQVELSAIGCTSRGEAQRKGKYTLLTNMFNDQVSFQTGLQGLSKNVLPGSVIHVLDPLRGGRPFTGRIQAAVGRVITLDRPVEAQSGDILYITKSNGLVEGRTVQVATSVGNVLTTTLPYSETPLPNAVWYLESQDLKSQLFRVTKITSPNDGVYEISAVQYNDSKYGAIDNGARLESRPISVVPPNIQVPVEKVEIKANTYVEQTMAITTMTISWPQTQYAVSYEVQWRMSDGDWVNAGVVGANEVDIKGIYTGEYLARVRAINSIGIGSTWTYSMLTNLEGKEGKPPVLASLTTTSMLFGIRLDWQFPEFATDTLYTQIMYSEGPNFANAVKLGDFAYPTDYHEMHGLKAGQRFYFWARLQDRTGNLGDWYPLDTVPGVIGAVMLNDNGQYNDYFAGMIGNTALDKTLYDRIELIDGNGPGSVNERLQNAVNDLEDQISNITDALVYDPTKAYLKGDIVRLGNKLYQAQEDTPAGVAPPALPNWKDVGEILEDTNGLITQVNINTQNIGVIDGKLQATASAIESMQASFRDDDGNGELEDALAGWNAHASIVEERRIRTSADEAFASQLNSMNVSIADNKASITTLNQVVVTNDQALAQRLDALEVTVNDTVTAAINSEAIIRANADGALSQRIDTVVANMLTDVQVQALIQTETDARVAADLAQASQITNIQTSLGENSAAIQIVAEAQTDLEGKTSTMWAVKMEHNANGQYVAAGIGLGIENDPTTGLLQSQFLVRADRFAVVNGTDTTTVAPFVVEGGQVFISTALIGDGFITNAMIGGTIQSDNYIPGQTGWAINKAGTIEFNGFVPGQGRLTINNNVVQVFDTNNRLRVRLGMWA